MSGYVVRVKTVSKIHKRQPDHVLHSLSGFPVLVRLDAFQPDPTGHGAPPRAETIREQLQHWHEHTVYMINPFRARTGRVAPYSPLYDGHLWIIPVEFKGSVTVSTLLLAFARTTALHLLSYPEIQGLAAPGFCTISKLVPGFYEGNWERIQQLWISVSSILFIVAFIFSPPLNLPRIVWWRRNTNITTGIVAAGDPDAALVNTLVLIWVSDLFWRAVDAGAVGGRGGCGVRLWLQVPSDRVNVFMSVDEENLIMQELSGLT
ncbi:hypothetical protein DL770_008766 [Monosporascus sp. CRB-9-2]|nr:hypothetical protein DL770_008766 [Monosporascus sp. CRB-9-2]